MPVLPVIHSAGTFDSSHTFVTMSQSPDRTMIQYELELYHQDGGVSMLNGCQYPIRRGMLLAARPGDHRSTTLPFRNHFIRISEADEEFDTLFEAIAGVTMLEDDEACQEIFERISKWFLSDDPFDQAAASAELYHLLRFVHTQRRRRSSLQTREGDVVRMAQEYIEAHYQEPFGVDELAQICHVSSPYLHRLFVSHLNTTPHNALVRRRLMAAKVLLINESASIADVAWQCGFQSASYFSDCFRRHVGMSPRKFRKETGYQL